jgi:hypothetical protein
MPEFGSLNQHLIASIFPVERSGNATGDGIQAMVTEASMEVELGWQSPFEQMGPEAVSPTLMAMVQSGEMQDIVGMIGSADVWGIGGLVTTIGNLAGQLGFGIGNIGELAASGVGRTGLTKMNSTQVFTGMPPIKINATLLFRAWANPASEVEAPFNTLMGWALPKCLQKDSVLTGFLSGGSGACDDGGGSAGGLDKLLPSLTPTMVGLTYKARTYKPLVIESVGFPMDSPSDASGRYVELLVPVTMATWQTYDAQDWAALSGSAGVQTIPL